MAITAQPQPKSANPEYDMREFDDVDKTRELIYSGVLSSVAKRFPIEDDEYRLELHNPRYAGPLEFGLEAQKQALMKNRNLQTPLVGTWRLVHKPTNNVVEEREDTVMQVPYYTQRGTFVNNGSEYTVVSQARLRPGVYVRKQRTGEIEGHFNVKSGTGRPFRVQLEPKTGLFKVAVGQSKLPLYPMLKALGATDRQLAQAWGAELLDANSRAIDPRALSGLYSHMAGYNADDSIDDDSKSKYLAENLPKFELDEGVVARTLGLQGAKGVTPDVLLRTTAKMLGVSRGEEEPDDRDSPRFSGIMGVEDLIRERVEKDAGKLTKNLMRKIRRAKSLKPVYRNALNPYVDSLMRSSLASPLEETNPLHVLEQLNRVTKLGEGGIGSAEAITDEARDVNPGNLGFADPIAGPECWTGEAEVMTRKGWVRWDSVSDDTEFACLVDGEVSYFKPEKLHVSDYSGKLYGAKTKYVSYLVTPNHRIWCRPHGGGKYRFEPAEVACNSKRLVDTGSNIPYAGDASSSSFLSFTLPDIAENHGNRYKSAGPIDIVAWASFIGWYLSEGSLLGARGNYRGVVISQQKPDYMASLEETLSSLPFGFCKTKRNGKIVGYAISGVQLARYLAQFGKSADKRIPEYLFEAPSMARMALLESLCFGDGRKKRETFTYCTTSRQLAIDVERLAFTLGIPSAIHFEADSRPQSRHGGCWTVHLHLVRERFLSTRTKWVKSSFYETEYTGKVYCATVPGGLLYCRHDGCGGHWSGNSEAIGIDFRTAYKTFKGKDGRLYGEFVDRSGETVRVAADDAIDSIVGFPGQDGDVVYAMKDGKMQKVPKKDVDYFVPSFAHMFSPNTNLNPMPTSVQAGRQFYGSKFWTQYMPQVQGDVPLVDSLMPDGKSTFSEYYGRKVGTLQAKRAGTVQKVTDKGITIVDDAGNKQFVETVQNLPFNRLSAISYFPTVKPGDKVNVGDMVAHSNFTDAKTGALNLGRNLKTAVIPFRGKSVAGDTNVFWKRPDGGWTYGPIASVPVGVGMESQALDTASMQARTLPVHCWAIHAPESAMYEISTMDGMSVTTTGDHSFVGFFEDADTPVKCTMEDLVSRRGMVPVVQPNIPFGTGATSIECKPITKSGQSAIFELDRDFGWVVGLYVAEGCPELRNGIPHSAIWAATEPEIVSKLESFFAVRNIRTKTRKWQHKDLSGTSGAVKVGMAALAAWLADNCVKYAWNKKIPDVLWTAPKEFAEGFIDGYFCGDGTVTDRQCTATTTSRLLADGLTFLLAGFGIRATWHEYTPASSSGGKHQQYCVWLFREFLDKFPRMSLARKQERVSALLKYDVKFSRDRIPIPVSELPVIRKLFNHRLPKDKYISRALLRNVYHELPALTKTLVDANVWWDVVTSAEQIDSQPYVYDLDMRPLCNFAVGSGWIVHNSNEDAYVISESAAKKLSTERLFGFDADSKQGTVINRNKFMSAFPDKFTKDQFGTLDDDGVVKPGTVLHKGDPIVAAVGPRLLSAADAQLGKLHKVLRNSFTDKSQVWEYDWPGTVVDVAMTAKGAKVNVKSTPPVTVGDKLCYSDDTEVLTRGGWKLFKDLSLQDEIAGLDPRTCGVEYMRPESIQSFRHDGDMYKVATKDVDLFVTLNHNLFCDIGAGFELVRADECLGSYKVFATAFDFSGKPGPVAGPSDGKIVGYRGTVYCCTLPKWHVLYVRRNGKAVWCGNSTRIGLKGITGKVIPDDKMPRNSVTNEPYDVLLNPMTVLSRVAPNQIMELALGKIAAKTGKQIRIPQIPPAEGWAAWVKKQMDDAGVEESSDLFDPESGKTIKGIGDGVMFVSAFHHLAEKKLSARGGSDAAYNSDEQAAHGGYSGGKKFCFAAHQPIRVFGGEDTIGHIVEKRIPAMVWAAGSDGAWGWHRISNWYSREGSIDEVLNIKVSNLPCESAPGRKRLCFGDKSLYVTKNHVIYRHDGSEVKAQDLIAGDWLASCGYVPTDDQLAILRGSMLGDGAICDLPSEHRFYSEMHSEKQSNYVKWKHEMLGGLVSNRSFTSRKLERVGTFFKKQGAKNVSYLSIHRHDVCDKLYNEFYVAGKKRLVNFDFSNLNELGLAVLFLDDGSAGVYKNKKSPQGNLATMGFLQDDCDRLALRISEIINVRCARQKDGSIYLSSAACERLAELVLKYVPLNAIPKSKRWLVEFVAKRVNDSSYVGVDNRCRLGTVPVKVLDVSQYVPSKPLSSAHIMLYDIEVEDVHRYCASDVLVSNSSMDVMAALSHGSTSVIKDVITIRGTKNEEFWKALKLGRPLPEPGVPFIYDKFLNTLRAGGINVVEKGDITQVLPMTDDDVDRLAKGTVDNSDMVDHEFEPRAGGLFDVGRTGGLNGRKWTAIKLPEPIPNPVMEEPIRRMLGLKVSELEDVIAGRKQLEGKTGGEAIKAALEKVDIDKMIEFHRDRVRTSRGANRDNSVKILGYLDSAKKNGVHPSKWVISKVPVLPPVFRPVSKMGDVALVADLNELYRDVIESSSSFSELKKDLPDSALDAERLNIYGAVKAAYGLGEPITPEGQSKRLKGAIRQVVGTRPKTGMAQSKVFSKPVDVVGRGVAAPDPNLDMDQVGIPEDAAWDLYKDFTLRNLVMHGYPAVRASEMIEKRTPEARDALDKEMSNRPVILDRAPTLHKFNLMGFYPHIAEGNTIRVSPIVCKGFNLDFDGDEQIGKVIVFLDNTLCSLLEDTKVKIEGNKKVENNLLTKLIPLCDTTGMKANLPVPVSQTPGKLFVADLADFPHGGLIAHKDGAKGPIDFYAVLPGTKVIALSSDGTATWADVSGWSVHRDREIEIVNLRDGRQIITDDDPRAVFGVEPKSGSLSFVRDTPTNAFNRGIVVPCVKNTGALYTETMSTVHVTDTDVAFKDLELDSEFGWVIGALVGDGWWDKSGFLYPGKYKNCFAICLADLAGDNAARLEAFIGKLSNGKYYYHRLEMKKENNPSRYGDTVKHTFLFDDSAEFSSFMGANCGGERDESTAGSANKHLPAFCFAGPADFRKSVVCGLIDTDGSVSVSTANGRKQLMCSLSTTSIRLATDMRLLCRTLGVRATITTTATPMGRPAWVVALSTADLKRENVLDNLCNPYKRMPYIETRVDTDHVLHDTVVITEDMANRLASGLYIPKQKTEDVHKAHFSAYMTLRKAKENGFVIARNALDNIVALIREEHNRKMAAADAAIDLLSRIVETDAKLLKDDRLTVLAQMSVLTKEARDRCKGKVRPAEGLEADVAIAKAYVTNSTALKRWEESGVNARGSAYADRVLAWLRALPRPRCVLDDPDVVRYLAFVGDRNVSWSPVESVERTNKVETGYDLTVPGYETFMSVEGVILSNTMNFHVPVSDKAVEQVKEKMLPSKNLFSLTDLKSARYSPTMEMTYGLYKLTDKPSAKPSKVFRTQAEAIAAYRSGEIGVNDPVEILEMK